MNNPNKFAGSRSTNQLEMRTVITNQKTVMNRSLSANSRLNPSMQFLQDARRELHKQIPFIVAPGMKSKSSNVVRNFSLSNLAALNQYAISQDSTGAGERDSLSKQDLYELDKEVMDSEVVTAPLLLAVLVAVIAQFLNGYNTGVMNAPEAVVFPGHTVMQWSFAVSAFAIGGPLGAAAGGYFANRNGRRGALLMCTWVFFFGGTIMALAPNIWALVLARFVVGFASGFSSVLVPIYLGELAPPILRGTFGTCTQFSMVIGILMSDIFAFPLANKHGWRFLFAITAFLAFIQLMLSPYLLESPRWLLSRDPDSAEAAINIKKLNGLRDEAEIRAEIQNVLDAHNLTNDSLSTNNVAALAHDDGDEGGMGNGYKKGGYSGLSDHDTAFERKRAKTTTAALSAELFTDKKHSLLLLCCLVMHVSQQLCGINAVFYYSNLFFDGIIDNPLVGTTVVAFVNVLATWVAQILMDRCFRRTLLLWSAGGMVVCIGFLTLALMGLVPKIISLFAVMGFVSFFEIGLGPIPWLIVAEMFESKYVAPAQSVACQVNWICNFIIGVAFPSLNAALGVWTFIPFGVVLMCCFIFTMCYLPETLNRTVDEIQQLIHGPDVQFTYEIDSDYQDSYKDTADDAYSSAGGYGGGGGGEFDRYSSSGTGGRGPPRTEKFGGRGTRSVSYDSDGSDGTGGIFMADDRGTPTRSAMVKSNLKPAATANLSSLA